MNELLIGSVRIYVSTLALLVKCGAHNLPSVISSTFSRLLKIICLTPASTAASANSFPNSNS
ncbi:MULTISPECIES: hypothetical protein [unclassified Chryseobacterium]|uniref:hypothetical protein n=1 Tax=unclassified Chryseobacterium TaxID=2593645 RepID=UPI00226AB3AF|nr:MULTISPECIES: hypothetical protein [unclassified Chryseobacterium]